MVGEGLQGVAVCAEVRSGIIEGDIIITLSTADNTAQSMCSITIPWPYTANFGKFGDQNIWRFADKTRLAGLILLPKLTPTHAL